MWEDPIVAEVRQVREAYAKKQNYDLRAMCEDLKAKEEAELKGKLMTTLTINLPVDLLNRLQTTANQVHVTPEDLAQAVIEDAIQRPSTEFERLLEELLHKNA
jgi:hypothetical protein